MHAQRISGTCGDSTRRALCNTASCQTLSLQPLPCCPTGLKGDGAALLALLPRMLRVDIRGTAIACQPGALPALPSSNSSTASASLVPAEPFQVPEACQVPAGYAPAGLFPTVEEPLYHKGHSRLDDLTGERPLRGGDSCASRVPPSP